MIFKRTKILATVGPTVNTPEAIRKLVDAGANGFRLNFSHGTQAERIEQIEWIRGASKDAKKPVSVLQDLQGPKIRLGTLKQNTPVQTGDVITLDFNSEHDGKFIIPVQYNLAEKVQIGEPIYIFDGKIRTTVVDVSSKSAVKLRVENDGILMSRKGINLPDTDFGGDILTDKDISDIEFGATLDIDFVALSFVQSADDIHNLRQLLVSLNSNAHIIAKIETKAAIDSEELQKIVQASDGVMVARGDLAVEAGAEIVPIVQRKIIALCRRYGKLSIVATQMMASMVDNPEPTRAEVSDIATAVILGADAVMLSDETANGHFPVEAVKEMKKTILYTQENCEVDPIKDVLGDSINRQNVISEAAVGVAESMEADAIVTETKTGATAVSIAAFRPNLPIISVTSDEKVAQQLALSYANKSFIEPDGERAGLKRAKKLQAKNFFKTDKVTVVIVSGLQPGRSGETDTIRIRVIE